LQTPNFSNEPRKSKPNGFKSDLGGYSIVPLLPIHFPRNVWFRNWQTFMPKWSDVPFCWN